MKREKTIPSQQILANISFLIATELVEHGTRFGYVMVLTEQPQDAPFQVHLIANGYGAPGSENADRGALQVLEDAAAIMRGRVARLYP